MPFPEGEGLIGCVHSCHLEALVEKSHTIETARCIYAPAYPPAVARRREITRDRNDDTRTRITDQANTLNATVIARSEATWQSPGREDLLAYTDKILARGGSPSKHSPAVAHRREISYNRHGTIRTRASLFARGGSPPCLCMLTAEKSHTIETARCIYPPAVARRREIPCNRNEDERTRIINQANDLNALSLRGAQRRGNLPEGKTYLRTRTKYSPVEARHLARACSPPRNPIK